MYIDCGGMKMADIKTCDFCGSKLPRLGGGVYKFADGKMCVPCFKKYNLTSYILKFKKLTREELEDIINPYRQELLEQRFSTFKDVGGILFDENQQLIHIPIQEGHPASRPTVFKYTEIYDAEVIEDGESITKGGLKSALVGDVLAGGVGAIVGATVGKKQTKQVCSKLSIKVLLNNPNVSHREYYLLDESKRPVLKKTDVYKKAYNNANELAAQLKQIILNNDKPIKRVEPIVVKNTQNDPIEEVKKLKELLDMDIITDEEFEKKKKELLNL